MNVITYDYTGYGIAPYEPSEENTYADIEQVLSYIVSYIKIPLLRIFLWSFSLGSGPTVEIASRYKYLGGVILAAPLASCLAWLNEKPIKEFNSKGNDIFANIDKITKIGTKILLFHGDIDEMIPTQHSYWLYEKAMTVKENDGPKAWLIIVENTSHNNIFLGLDDEEAEFPKKIKRYFEFLNDRGNKILENFGKGQMNNLIGSNPESIHDISIMKNSLENLNPIQVETEKLKKIFSSLEINILDKTRDDKIVVKPLESLNPKFFLI